MGYYRMIDGRNLDGHLLEMAEEAVKGARDGRISREDAETLFNAVKDGGAYTDIEKETMVYIRDNFQWTDSADEWFRKQIAIWAAEENQVF
jgi:hypothetical protein